MTKKNLKNKISSLEDKLKQTDIELRLLRSDFLVEKEKLAYRALFAEAQLRNLVRKNSDNISPSKKVLKEVVDQCKFNYPFN